MRNNDDIIYPTFSDAQKLFASYFTLQSNRILKDVLYDTIDVSFINTSPYNNIREVYNKIILRYYPNETSIKSSFINQVLSKENNQVTIFELPIGNSRADLCKINGVSVAYEIKTDLDNIQRLNKQINDYEDVFEKTFVICSNNKLEEIEKHIVDSCGIYIYHITPQGNIKFKLYRDSILSNKLNPNTQLNVFRKQELKQCLNISEIASRTEMTKYILDTFTPDEVNHLFKKIIKSRYQSQWDFLKNNHNGILEIDYQWFFKNMINPQLIYY